MKERKKKDPTINMIKVDEETAEPVIVEVDINDLPENYNEDEQIEKMVSDVEKKMNDTSAKSIGKQLMMNRILGFNEDKAINKRQRNFKIIVTIAFIVLVVGVLIWTFYNDFFANDTPLPSWQQIRATLSSNWYFLLIAVLALFLCYLFKGLKLSFVSKYMTKKFRFRLCFETGIIGHYYNNVTPLAVGGQPFEIYHMTKHGIKGGTASSMSIATYFLNQIAFVILGFAAVICYKYNALGINHDMLSALPYTLISTLAILGLSFCVVMPVLVVIFSLFPKIGATLVKFVMWLGGKFRIVKNPKLTTFKTIKAVVSNAKCLKKMATNPFIFLTTFFLSFAESFALSSIAFFTLKFFGFDMPDTSGLLEWAQVIQLCTILYAAISFIPTPGNSGAADYSFYTLFATGLAAGLAFPAMMVWRILSFYSLIIIGFVFTTVKKKRDVKRELAAISQEEMKF